MSPLARVTTLAALAALVAACGGTPTEPAPAGEAPAAEAVVSTAAPAVESAATALATEAVPVTSNMATAKINLNTATEEQLLTIPGMGEKMIDEFMEYRPYNSIVTFRDEIGKYVDPAQVADYELYVFVPVDADASDAATLMQIPGVTQAVADSLIAARPFGSNDAFIQALAQQLSEEQAVAAKDYLKTQ